MIPLSVLDLAPIAEGGTAADSFRNSRDLAQHAEKWGFNRFWVAEHHNMPGIASAATAVVMAHVAAGTERIRIGAGGIMLPNHAPLQIAEQFGTLEALFPGRIELGLGRAPGTDMATARALRRTLVGDEQRFPQDVMELLAYLGPAEEGQRVRAYPGQGSNVPVWILGSSTYGAQLAAMLGLPYAFASHFAPQQMMEAIAIYRERFEPSRYAQKPYLMLGFNVFAAETEAEARFLSTSLMQAFVNLRTGRASPLPPPREGYERELPPEARAMLASVLSCAAIGDPASVQSQMADFIARTGADELMVTSQMFDHTKRLRSFEIVAEARDALRA
ncbi:MAG: LLM class flavin-dependent oxidoreductase [Hyphomonadaceae bacterium]